MADERFKRAESHYTIDNVSVAFGNTPYPEPLKRINVLASCAQWLESRVNTWEGRTQKVLLHDYADSLRAVREYLLELEEIGHCVSIGSLGDYRTTFGNAPVVIISAESYRWLVERANRYEDLCK